MTTWPEQIPVGSWWRHRNGNAYVVIAHTNETDIDERYPATVVYQGENGKKWSRRADDWFRSMTLAPGFVQTTVFDQGAQDLTFSPQFRRSWFALAECLYRMRDAMPGRNMGCTIRLPGAEVKFF